MVNVELQKSFLKLYQIDDYKPITIFDIINNKERTCIFTHCLYCCAFTSMTKDHIVPKSRGGSNHANNIALVCLKCNQIKANRDLFEYNEYLKGDKHIEFIIKQGIIGETKTLIVKIEKEKYIDEKAESKFWKFLKYYLDFY